jgi:RNA polymerase sigma-70 factor (ECF subfamily)
MPMFVEQARRPAESPETVVESLSDEEVVQRVLDGDAASFELIMRRYNVLLFRVARSIVGNDSEAEDVVQEAYLRAFEHLRQFEGRSRFSTWLTRIAVYEATGRRHKQQRRHVAASEETLTDATHSFSCCRDGLEAASQNELGRLLTHAVDALPPDLRIVFTLRLVERLSTEQTAECLELTPSNVKVRLHRARIALQSWIDCRIGQEARQLYEFGGGRCDRVVRTVLNRIAPDLD